MQPTPSVPSTYDALPLAKLAAQTADALRGQQTVLLDMRKSTPIVDYFIVTTAASARQMRAVAAEVKDRLKAAGSVRRGIEGEDSTAWLLMDFGDIVLHVFSPEARALYDIENLWADAPRIDWKTGN